MIEFEKGAFRKGRKRAKELLSKEQPKSLDDWIEWFNNIEDENHVTLWNILHVKFAPVSVSPKESESKINLKS